MKMGYHLLNEDGDRTSLWTWRDVSERSSSEAWLLKRRLWFPVVCLQGRQMQLIITKGCLFCGVWSNTTILKSPNFCLNTFLRSNVSHSLCSG